MANYIESDSKHTATNFTDPVPPPPQHNIPGYSATVTFCLYAITISVHNVHILANNSTNSSLVYVS